jgi:hypothetical protein
VKSGLLPFATPEGRAVATLARNDSNHFEDRWVRVRANPRSPSPLLRGLDVIDLPVRHGEGKLLFASDAVRARVEAEPCGEVEHSSGAGRANDVGSPGRHVPAGALLEAIASEQKIVGIGAPMSVAGRHAQVGLLKDLGRLVPRKLRVRLAQRRGHRQHVVRPGEESGRFADQWAGLGQPRHAAILPARQDPRTVDAVGTQLDGVLTAA